MGSGKEQGFTYLAVLLTAATMTAAMGAAATVYSQGAQREKEAELLFIGNQYRQAIGSFYERSPGGAKRYPQRVEDLLEDRRGPVPVHHLRQAYKDPITGKELALIEAPGAAGFMGVSSPSEEAPIKMANFRERDAAFKDMAKYSDWKFTHSPVGLSVSQTGNTAAVAK
jgi:type II secretory pathway pseudopilin PulG